MFRGVGIAIAVAIIIAANYAPLFFLHLDQDKCTFGPVSNEQYRAYLLEALKRQRIKWSVYSSDGREIGEQLNVQLSEMLTPDITLYERIAISHAILRAIGAEYLNTNGRKEPDPFRAAHERRDDVRLHYQVDINRFVLFQPYPRRLLIGAALRDPDIPRRDPTQQSDRIGAVLVSVFDHPADSFLTSSGENCPPIPTAAEAARHQSKQK